MIPMIVYEVDSSFFEYSQNAVTSCGTFRPMDESLN